MSNYQYGQDILQDALFRSGERTDLSGGSASDYLAAAKRYIMRGYYDTLTEYPFPRSQSTFFFQTVDKITNTLTYTKGSAAATLTTGSSTSLVGRKVYIDNEGILYKILAHDPLISTTTITLDAPYTEASGSGACTIYQDEYYLASDVLALHRAWDRSNPAFPITIISAAEMAETRSMGIGTEGFRVQELSIIEGYEAWRVEATTTTVGFRVKVHPWPAEARTIEYTFTVRPATLTWDSTATTDTPFMIDEEHRHLLADYAVAFILQDKKDA